MNLSSIETILSVVFWPISLYLSNRNHEYLVYTFPSILIVISLYLHSKNFKYALLPLILIPVISHKLAIFPIIFFASYAAINTKNKRLNYVPIILSFLVMLFYWKPFFGQTIFVPDYEAQQKVIRDQRLYPSVIIARTFHNKAKNISDKFVGNFLALIDPNNYFFSFHPREELGNQNLPKFPFLALPIFLYGIFKMEKNKYSHIIPTLILSGVSSLALLTNFDRNDFILWAPISLIFAYGFRNLMRDFKYSTLFICVYTIFLISEFVSLFLRYI